MSNSGPRLSPSGGWIPLMSDRCSSAAEITEGNPDIRATRKDKLWIKSNIVVTGNNSQPISIKQENKYKQSRSDHQQLGLGKTITLRATSALAYLTTISPGPLHDLLSQRLICRISCTQGRALMFAGTLSETYTHDHTHLVPPEGPSKAPEAYVYV